MDKREPNKRPLTKDLTVRALIAADRPYIVWDETSALGVRVMPTGSRSFLVTYQHAGRSRWFHLGRYPAVPLAEARTLAGKIKARAALGEDPQGEKVAARHRQHDEISFKGLVDEYLVAKRTLKSLPQYQRAIDADILPALANKKAVDVNETDIERIVTKIEGRGSPQSAAMAKAVISAIYRWAMTERRPKIKIAASPTTTVKTGKSEARERVLSIEEIANLWPQLGDSDADRAIRVLLLTGQRPGEVGGLVWEEVGPDWWWNLPEARSKNGRAHRIWIGPRVRPLLGQRQQSGAVFPSLGLDRTAQVMAINFVFKAAAKRAAIEGVRPHDCRRTMTTLAAEHGITDAFMLDRMTNHALKGEQKTYQRAGFLRQMRAAWDDWADLLLDRIVTGKLVDDIAGKVVSIEAA